MTRLGLHLKTLIYRNQLNIYSLAKTAGIERTVIHKIISNDRIPSEEFILKLVSAIPLSPEEKNELLENYKISKIGEFRYHQRIQVKKMLEAIAEIESSTMTTDRITAQRLPEPRISATTASGIFAVNSLVKSVIAETLSATASPGIDFVIPVNYKYFFDELIISYLTTPSLSIRQIVSFLKKSDFSDYKNENIEVLSYVLPFAFAIGSNYCPHYIYRNSPNLESTQLMPYFLLTSTGILVLISRELDRAALIRDKDIVAIYREKFEDALRKANILLNQMNSLHDLLEYCSEIDYDVPDSQSHWIEPEPCLGSTIRNEEIEEKFLKDIPQRDELVALTQKHFSFLRKTQNNNIDVCTIDGLYRMIQNRQLYFTAPSFCSPIEPDQFAELLERLKDMICKNLVKVLFVNPSKIRLPNKMLIQINRKTGLNFILFDQKLLDFRVVCLSEESINEAFSDFIESIEETDLVYNAQDSLAIVEKVIAELLQQ